MKRWKKAMGIGMAAVTFVTGCGTKEMVKQEVKKVVEKTASGNEKNLTFSEGINRFSLRMLEELNETNNMFLSPYSIGISFSMLANGAQGETKEQIKQVLGISDLEKWNQQASMYMQKEWGKNTFLKNANGVWVSDQLTLAENAEKDYFSLISEFYQAERHYQDLTTDATKKEINAWVKKHTGGMIEEIVNENFKDNIKMALYNAIYFEGKWECAFEKEMTEKVPFYGKREQQKVDMMHLYGENFSYIEKNGLRGIELPYKESGIVMDLVMPSDLSKDIMQVFGALSEDEKLAFFEDLSKAEATEIATLGVPKFETEYTVGEELKGALCRVGMQQAFSPIDADFGKIAHGLFVDQIAHKAKVIVEETGTKAAAVTEIAMGENCAMLEEEPIDFIADHPFLYVIRDVEEDVILFIGTMYEAKACHE